MTRAHRLRLAGAAAVATLLLAVTSAASVPIVRHIASGWWNDPAKLAALPENPQVHYEEGAIDRARAVAAALPTAMARIELVQGRPFAHPITIGVYASREGFAAANGTGVAGATGVTFFGHVILSPALFTTQRQRLAAILTHELSHAHIRTWISELTYIRLPNWFKEGLAVMVSGGGGAEGVSERAAREAIRRGDHIAIERAGSLFHLTGVRFESTGEIPYTPFRFEMAYRQAGLFVTFLHDTNPTAFEHMMNAILDGRPFADAVMESYGTDLRVLWLDFRQDEEEPEDSSQ